jgi:hypothetical protein
MGRGLVRLQWQARSAGNFENAAIFTDPVEHDTGTPTPENGSWSPVRTTMAGLGPGGSWRWRLRLRGDSPYFPWNGWHAVPGNSQTEAKFRTPQVTSEAPDPDWTANDGPRFLRLGPNPFRTVLDLSFMLSRPAPVRLTVHDASGRSIATLATGVHPAGRWAARWDGAMSSGEPAPSGVYFARLQAGGEVRRARIVRVR